MAKLFFNYGAMNCGKTTKLLQTAYNYEERGLNVIVLKPLIDKKGNDSIVSRLGVVRKVDYLVNENESIKDIIKNYDKKIDVILVDEAQFLKAKQVDELYEITKMKNIPVLAYGLRNDFLMQPFEGSARLLSLADEIEELKTICRCGKKATQNMRLLNNKPIFEGDSVLIDDGTSKIVYESVCGICYLKARNNCK